MQRHAPWVSIAIGLLAAHSVQAEDAMRCGTRLASTGDSKYQVRQVCGEPADISLVGAMREPRMWYSGYRYYYLDPPWIVIPVEVWTYNFGPTKLLRRLRFEGEELVDIASDGYGY